MDYEFELIDKSNRKIHISKKQWVHIRKKHPEIEELETLKDCLKNPDKITNYNFDETVHYYYKYLKYLKSKYKLLCLAVKYLNGKGYIITAYFDNKVK